MTTLSASSVSVPGTRIRTTVFERTLLRTASGLDAFVSTRLARRAGEPGRRALAAETSTTTTRREAQALGAFGMIPR